MDPRSNGSTKRARRTPRPPPSAIVGTLGGRVRRARRRSRRNGYDGDRLDREIDDLRSTMLAWRLTATTPTWQFALMSRVPFFTLMFQEAGYRLGWARAGRAAHEWHTRRPEAFAAAPMRSLDLHSNGCYAEAEPMPPWHRTSGRPGRRAVHRRVGGHCRRAHLLRTAEELVVHDEILHARIVNGDERSSWFREIWSSEVCSLMIARGRAPLRRAERGLGSTMESSAFWPSPCLHSAARSPIGIRSVWQPSRESGSPGRTQEMSS